MGTEGRVFCETVWCAAAVCSRTSSAIASAEASVSACAALQQPERALGQRESTPLSAPLSIWSCHSRSPLAASRRGLLVFSVEDPHLEGAGRRAAWRLLRLLGGLGYEPRYPLDPQGLSGRRLTGTARGAVYCAEAHQEQTGVQFRDPSQLNSSRRRGSDFRV